MKKETAFLQYSVDIECPHCKKLFDLIENNNDDGVVSTPIFNNEWNAVDGMEIECDHCHKNFELEKIEY